MNHGQGNYRTIDVASITRDLIRQWWAILLFSVTFAILVNLVANIVYKPIYATSATFVVTTRGTNTSIYADISSATDTATRFRTVLESNVLKRTIAKDLNINEYDAVTDIKILEETNLIVLTVKHKSALMAYRYIQSIMMNYSVITDFVIKNVVLDVIQNPTIPLMPSNPNHSKLYTLIGFLVGFAFAVLYVGYYSYLKDTVKNSREASSKLAARLLGTVYHEKIGRERRKTRKCSMVITNPILSFRYSESCRMAASRIRSRMDRKGTKTLLVTSVAENEGKSTVASNVAISIAQEGKKVLLIDADFRKPSLYKIFDIDRSQVANLVGILRSGEGMQKSIVKLKKYPLYFILNNTNTGSIDDVLANNRFRSLIRFARTKFDYIILDTAPMGLVPDAEGIAELCDASLIIVREDTILAKNINDAIDTLNGTNAKVIGIVFNDAKLRGVSAIRTNSSYSSYNYNRK